MKKRIAALLGAGLLMCSVSPVFAATSPKAEDVKPAKPVTDQKSPATGMADTLPVAAAICAAGLSVCGLKVKFDK